MKHQSAFMQIPDMYISQGLHPSSLKAPALCMRREQQRMGRRSKRTGPALNIWWYIVLSSPREPCTMRLLLAMRTSTYCLGLNSLSVSSRDNLIKMVPEAKLSFIFSTAHIPSKFQHRLFRMSKPSAMSSHVTQHNSLGLGLVPTDQPFRFPWKGGPRSGAKTGGPSQAEGRAISSDAVREKIIFHP